MDKINNYIDKNGKIKMWPSKKEMKAEILIYLAEKFEFDRIYTEKEVNAIIDSWHTFGDYFLLRRELIESGLMGRKRDGSRYWKVKPASDGI